MKVIFLLLVLSFSSCSVNLSKIGKKELKDFTDKIEYVRDKKTGLCFAVIASRETMSTDSSGLAMAEVSCRKIKKVGR